MKPLVVMRAGAAGTGESKFLAGADVEVRPEWAPQGWVIERDKVLFVAGGQTVPWDLVPAGFRFLDRWDVAAPLCGKLVSQLGGEDDQRETAAVLLDARVPAYSTDLLFFRKTEAAIATMIGWRLEARPGRDPRLAFMRALAKVKPLFLALPSTWLAVTRTR